jgi:hypothetical protein
MEYMPQPTTIPAFILRGRAPKYPWERLRDPGWFWVENDAKQEHHGKTLRSCARKKGLKASVHQAYVNGVIGWLVRVK